MLYWEEIGIAQLSVETQGKTEDSMKTRLARSMKGVSPTGGKNRLAPFAPLWRSRRLVGIIPTTSAARRHGGRTVRDRRESVGCDAYPTPYRGVNAYAERKRRPQC